MPQMDPKVGEIYRHFKGNLYQITNLAKDADTGRAAVVYQALYGDFTTYVRDYEEFVSGVDYDKYPDSTDRFRFTFVPKASLSQDAAPEAQSSTQQPQSPRREVPKQPEGKWYEAPKVRSTATEPEAKPAGAKTLQDLVIDFLDERDFELKDKILSEMAMRSDITDGVIDNLAASIDIVIDPGPIDSRLRELRNCVRTRGKYETSRLR